MGFSEASGKAPARWVAVHHGRSGEAGDGNDHVHIAASMVREDGTRWEVRLRDWPRSQQVCRELELAHGLTPVDGRQFGTAVPGVKPAERFAAEHRNEPQTARQQLADRLRAAAVASTSEGEWLRRVQAGGVVITPRFAAGSTDVVVGYRAALKPGSDSGEPGPFGLLRRRSDRQAAFRGRPTGVRGREVKAIDPDVAARNLDGFTRRLAVQPVGDPIGWADAARDTSGALSAWARFDSANAAELMAAASAIGQTAQQRRAGGQLGRRVKESPRGTAFLLLAAARDDKGTLAGAASMAQLVKTAEAIRHYHHQSGNLRPGHLHTSTAGSVDGPAASRPPHHADTASRIATTHTAIHTRTDTAGGPAASRYQDQPPRTETMATGDDPTEDLKAVGFTAGAAAAHTIEVIVRDQQNWQNQRVNE